MPNRDLHETTEENRENQRHFLEFRPAFSNLRSQISLDTDLGLIEFFKQIVLRRAQSEEI